MDLTKLAEEKIAEAVERGEFDNLEGAGEKIDLTAYFNTPAEFRLGYSILRSNRFVPGEVTLLNEIAELKEKISTAAAGTREKLEKDLGEKQLALAMLLERNHAGSRRR